MGKGILGIDDGVREGESLALVYGNGPCQAYGVLHKGTFHLFPYLLRLLVEHIATVLPHLALHLYVLVIVLASHYKAILVYGHYLAYHAIVIAFVHRVVVLDKHHLSPRFQCQGLVGRVGVFGELALDFGGIGKGIGINLCQFPLVDVLRQYVVGGQLNVALICGRNKVGHVPLVQLLQSGSVCLVLSNLVQNIQKVSIRLSVGLLQLDGGIKCLAQSPAAEEERSVVILGKHFPLLLFHHGSQLLQVANHQQLHTTKGQVRMAVSPQYGIHGIQQVGTHHTDFVYDQQVYATNQFYLLLAKAVFAVFLALKGGVGHIGSKRQLEERVYRHSLRIDGGNTRGCSHYHAFGRRLCQIFQERSLARTSLAGKEQVHVGVFYYAPGSV